MGRDQEVDREEDGMMTSNNNKGQLGLEKRERDNIERVSGGLLPTVEGHSLQEIIK